MPHRAALLVIEDDPATLEVLHAVLADEGYRVTVATNLRDALAALQAATFDLILTDALVAYQAGQPAFWSTLDTIAAHAGAARLIILSAQPAYHFADFRQHGYTALVGKPFALDELLAVVARTLTLPVDHQAQ